MHVHFLDFRTTKLVLVVDAWKAERIDTARRETSRLILNRISVTTRVLVKFGSLMHWNLLQFRADTIVNMALRTLLRFLLVHTRIAGIYGKIGGLRSRFDANLVV